MDVQRYFFDSKTSTCKQFTYSGCKGNANNFQTSAACRAKCAEKQGSRAALKDICSLPLSEGVCKGFYERWDGYFTYSCSCVCSHISNKQLLPQLIH